jgi:hypothetical protein
MSTVTITASESRFSIDRSRRHFFFIQSAVSNPLVTTNSTCHGFRDEGAGSDILRKMTNDR